MNQNTLDQTLDQALVLGPITATGVGVNVATQNIDLGTGLVNFDIIYRLTNCAFSTNESYKIVILGAATVADLSSLANLSILSTTYYGKGSEFESSVNKPLGTYIESCNNTTSPGTQTTMESQVVTYSRFIAMVVTVNGTAPSIVVQANVVISR
jgi:hypothetical protein